MFKKTTFFMLFVIAFFNDALFSHIAWAQTTRSLVGTINLDVGSSDRDRLIDVTVNNHSFAVIPPAFTIIRPITSSRSTLVSLPAGDSSFFYQIDDIISDPVNSDPVDYTVELRCLACANTIPTQFYSPDGNRFGMANATFIDPDDLPSILNFTAITRASITGELELTTPANRALTFTVTVFSVQNPQSVFASLASLVLPAGESRVRYSVLGLNRDIGNDQYTVQIQCTNCVGQSRRPQIFSELLSPDRNHSEINFTVSDISPVNLAPIIDLILR